MFDIMGIPYIVDTAASQHTQNALRGAIIGSQSCRSEGYEVAHHWLMVKYPSCGGEELFHDRTRVPLRRMGSENASPIRRRYGVCSALGQLSTTLDDSHD